MLRFPLEFKTFALSVVAGVDLDHNMMCVVKS